VWIQIEDLTQTAQLAAAEKLKSAAEESSKTSEKAAAAAAVIEPESESDEEVWLPLTLVCLLSALGCM